MIDDAELLRRFAESRSEEAFAELVQRRIGLVYAVALRHTRDAQRAEDVTQRVFTDLARKARTLAERPALAGWLYRSAQFAASDAVRVESRRQAREQEAFTMEQIGRDAPDPDWEQLRPVLDDVLNDLDERDRDAVLLRFFGGRPFAEIGMMLRLSDNAARMRVERALDRMRAHLARRGVTSTAAAIGTVLASHAGAAAPAGLAATVTGAALAGAAPGAVATTLTLMSTTKIGIAAAVVVAGAAAGWWWEHEENARLRGEIAALRAQMQAATQKAGADRAVTGATAGIPRSGSTPKTGNAAAVGDAGTAPRPVVAPAANSETTGGMRPVEGFANVGRATARATLETSYWARRNVDLATLGKAVTFDEKGRAKADALFALLGDDLRTQYGSPEFFAATMLADLPSPRAIEVLSETERDADNVDLKLRVENADGKVSTRTVQYTRGDDGWRQVIPATLVDAAVNSITKNPEQVIRPKVAAPPSK